MVSNIKRSTQVLAIVPLLLLVLSKILKIQHDTSAEFFLWSSYVAEVVFIFHLIVENRTINWFYSIILGLIIIGSIGDLFRIMHWPFAATMVIAGLLGSFLPAPMLLYSAIDQKNKRNNRYEFLIIGVCILLQLILAVGIVVFYNLPILTYAKFLHYPLVAMCGTILLKRTYENLGERNFILYLLVHSLFVIIKQTFHLFA